MTNLLPSSTSSSCSWRVRRVFFSLILKMKLVHPSLSLSSYVPSNFWFILQCLFWYSACVHPLSIHVVATFLVLFYFLCYVLCSIFLSNTLILFLWQIYISIYIYIYFTFVPAASWYYQSFIYSPTDAPVSCLKNNIKIYIKTAPVLFIHQLMHQWVVLKKQY